MVRPLPTCGADAVRDYLHLCRAVARKSYPAVEDEAFADALIALWQAGETWNRVGKFESFALQRMRWRVIDGLRVRNGRVRDRHGDPSRRPAVLVFDPTQFPEQPTLDDWVGQLTFDEAKGEVLAHCHTDRERLFVERRAAGWTDLRIAGELGVTEGRVCQMRTQILARYAGRKAMRRSSY